MPFINRLSALFSADVHAILDRIEDPLSLLKQAVRTMEEEIDQSELTLQRLVDERERVQRRSGDLQSRLQRLDAELDVCFESNADELAKGLVRRKLEVQHHLQRLTDKASSLGEMIEKRRATVVEQRRQLERMREKLELLHDEHDDTETSQSVESGTRIETQDVEVAFLREKQRRASQ